MAETGSTSSALRLVSKVNIPASTGKFVAADKFVVNTDKDGMVKISGMVGLFRKLLLPKVEDPIAEQVLCHSMLRKPIKPFDMVSELGGDEKVEVALSEVWELLMGQMSCQKGPLLTNGHANLFFVRDIEGLLRVLVVICNGEAWNLGIGYGEPWEWYARNQVFHHE